MNKMNAIETAIQQYISIQKRKSEVVAEEDRIVEILNDRVEEVMEVIKKTLNTYFDWGYHSELIVQYDGNSYVNIWVNSYGDQLPLNWGSNRKKFPLEYLVMKDEEIAQELQQQMREGIDHNILLNYKNLQIQKENIAKEEEKIFNTLEEKIFYVADIICNCFGTFLDDWEWQDNDHLFFTRDKVDFLDISIVPDRDSIELLKTKSIFYNEGFPVSYLFMTMQQIQQDVKRRMKE